MPNPSQPALQPQKPPSPGRTYMLRNRSVFVPQGMLAVGLIIGAHGLRGEVRVELHTDFPERFTPGHELLLGPELRPIEILTSRPHKNEMLILFAGVDGRTPAEELRGNWLFIPEDSAAELEEGSYWIHDIIGMDVEDTDGRRLGRVVEVLATGANDVYVLKPADGVNQGRDLLLPAIPEVILSVDVAARLITVALMPGMVDE